MTENDEEQLEEQPSSEEELTNNLPLIENWIEHETDHGPINWTSSQGHICLVKNCIVNENPRSAIPIFRWMDRNVKTRKKTSVPADQAEPEESKTSSILPVASSESQTNEDSQDSQASSREHSD